MAGSTVVVMSGNQWVALFTLYEGGGDVASAARFEGMK